MRDRVAFFLPTRKGSERVKDKNTRPFAGFNGGLIENKIIQLMNTNLVDEIILSTNDSISIEIGEYYAKHDHRIRVIRRPEELCLSSTNLQDLICYVPTITYAEHILWGHVTTPMADAQLYDEAIQRYFDCLTDSYDSLVGVSEIKNFLLDREGRIINNTTGIPWPRTQDLEPLYQINHTVFLTKRETYIAQKNRLGSKPFLYRTDEVHSFDIDWPEDFAIAEILYNHFVDNK